jgi:hypothetical protein
MDKESAALAPWISDSGRGCSVDSTCPMHPGWKRAIRPYGIDQCEATLTVREDGQGGVMTESPYEDASVSPDADSDDILLELQRAGREATLGFSDFRPSNAFGAVSPGATTAMTGCCPSCANTKLLVTIDHRQQRNYFCPDCGMCWHREFGQLRRVERDMCPGCPFCEHCPAWCCSAPATLLSP